MDYAGDPIRETIDRLVTLFRTCGPDIRSSTQACRWEAAYIDSLARQKGSVGEVLQKPLRRMVMVCG
jgi:hypothetical protein